MKYNIVTFIAVLFGILVITVLGNIVTIGTKLGELTNVYLEYGFYIIFLFLTGYFIICPLLKVYFSPEFPALKINDEWDAKKMAEFARQLAKNNCHIPDIQRRREHKQSILASIADSKGDVDILRSIIENEIKLRIDGSKELNVLGINRKIREYGKGVFMITSISQNSKLDSLSVLIMNYKLISDIVLSTGFRPSKPQLVKLYIRVVTAAFITYFTSSLSKSIDDIHLSDSNTLASADDMDTALDSDFVSQDIDEGSFGSSIIENLRKLKKMAIPGILIGSVIDGCINTLMTLRIGYITRAYLLEGPKSLNLLKDRRRIKMDAIKESFKVMPQIIVESSSSIGKTVTKLILGIFKR